MRLAVISFVRIPALSRADLDAWSVWQAADGGSTSAAA